MDNFLIKYLKKWVLDLANRAETFVLESIESRIMSDDSKEKKLTQNWSTLKLKLEKAEEILPSTCRIGKKKILQWL